MRHAKSAAFILLLLGTTSLSAADIPLTTRIDAVTVYADGATVTRVGPIKAEAGSHSLILSGLPDNVDPDTIRISGEKIEALTITGIDARLSPGAPADDSAYAKAREGLMDKLEAERAKFEALSAQKASMLKFSNALPSQLAGEKSALEVEKWPVAWQAIGDGVAAVTRKLNEVNKRIAEIEAEITALDNAHQGGGTAGQPKREIVIAAEADAAIDGAFSISYQTYGASWRPVHDARLVTTGAEPVVELAHRAMISQSTGEDWSDVALSLSTVSLNRSAAAPDLTTLSVNIFEPVPQAASHRALVGGEAEGMVLAAPVPASEAAPGKPKMADEEQAQVDLGAYQASFTIPSRATLKTDGAQKGVLIARDSQKVELIIKTVPALDQTAYLEARFTVPEGGAPFLPGTVNLRRDNAFIGRIGVAMKQPGETVALGFGADDLVKVTRTPLRKRENDPNPNGTRNQQEEYRHTVENLHDFPVRVTMLDRLPVSENTAITVEPLSTNTPATDKAVDGKRGVLGWNFELTPKEKKDIRFGWRLRSPADRDLAWSNVVN